MKCTCAHVFACAGASANFLGTLCEIIREIRIKSERSRAIDRESGICRRIWKKRREDNRDIVREGRKGR